MLTRDKLVRALRARGKSDQLAQMAADMLDHIADRAHPDPTPAPSPDGFIITERVRDDSERNAELRARVNAMPIAKPPAKKTPAKKAVKR